jgi:hypothetical protein
MWKPFTYLGGFRRPLLVLLLPFLPFSADEEPVLVTDTVDVEDLAVVVAATSAAAVDATVGVATPFNGILESRTFCGDDGGCVFLPERSVFPPTPPLLPVAAAAAAAELDAEAFPPPLTKSVGMSSETSPAYKLRGEVLVAEDCAPPRLLL